LYAKSRLELFTEWGIKMESVISEIFSGSVGTSTPDLHGKDIYPINIDTITTLLFAMHTYRLYAFIEATQFLAYYFFHQIVFDNSQYIHK
jgi:hypothetical protein